MENLINVLIFASVVITFCISVAMWKGLKFNITNPNCNDEVESVKSNIAFIKVGSTVVTILLIIALIVLGQTTIV